MASIKKRPDGKYRARYRDPSGKEHSGHFARKVDAEKWVSDQVTKVGAGMWVDPQAGRRTFREYATTWLEGQLHHRPATRSITRSRLESHLIPTFGKQPLSQIQRVDVQAWVAGLNAKKLAASTVEGLYRLLSQILAAAVDDRVLASNPCHKITLPERDRNRITVPTEEQVAAIVAAASRYGQGLVVVAAGTGLRVSELAGLTPDRVDFLRRTVTVDRQIVGQTAAQPRFGPPKTAASVRTIPVPQSLIDVMARQLAQWPSDTTLFRTQKRHPWTRASLGEEWRGWCETADVTGVRFHDLRHFYASALIASGQSVKVVQQRLGHASAALTLDTYAHLWPADEDATRAVIDGLLGPLVQRIAD